MFIRSSAEKRRIKLDELVESQGYDGLEQFLEATPTRYNRIITLEIRSGVRWG
jgi:hypothetical protein